MFTGEAILKLFAFRLVRRSPFANSAAKRTAHERKTQDLITLGFPVAYINQLRKYEIPVLKESVNLDRKVKKKFLFNTFFFFSSFSLLRRGFFLFCLH